MREAVILSAVRLPTGRFLGSLKGFSAPALGAMVVKEAVARAAVPPQQVDEGIVGEKDAGPGAQRDAWARKRRRRASAAIKAGRFKDEILPVPIPQKKGDPVPFAVDESPREDTSLEALARLKPAFKDGGTVTAGNAPGVNDGAAALVVCSAETAAALGRKPLARIVAQAVAGLEPSLVMMAPVEAVRKLWKKTGWSAASVDLVELNEAFAVQAVGGCPGLGPR